MARDGSGNFSLPAGNPAVGGTAISSNVHNSTLNEIAVALTASIAKDGQTTATADLPMGTQKHTNVGDAAARNQYGAVGQIQDNDFNVAGSVSGTNTIVGSLAPAITAYSAGMHVTLIPANTNSGAATIALNGLTALDILKLGGTALIAGDLKAGVPAHLICDGDDFYLQNPAPATPTAVLSSVAGTNTITAAATPALSGYTAHMLAVFTPANSNTGATTLNIDSLGALDVQVGAGAALIGGELIAGIPAVLALDSGGDDWLLLNPCRVTGSFTLNLVAADSTTVIASDTAYYVIDGTIAHIHVPELLASSSDQNFYTSGYPAGLRPTFLSPSDKLVVPIGVITTSGSPFSAWGSLHIAGDSSTWYLGANTYGTNGGFGSGTFTKGIQASASASSVSWQTISYPLRFS